MEKSVKKPTRNEKERLYEHIAERMKTMHKNFEGFELIGKNLSFVEDELKANLIHAIRNDLYHLQHIIWHFLFDETPAGEILKQRR